MRLLLCNPNTDRELTVRLSACIRPRLGTDDSLARATAAAGAAFINSDAAIAVACDAAYGALASAGGDCDAVLLGCFGDLGVAPLRRLIGRPIISLSDAFFAVAPLLPGRVAIVTTSAFWAARLRQDAQARGQMTPIVPLHQRMTDVPETRAELLARCRATIAEVAADGGCDAVVLGGAVLAVLYADLAGGSALPVIDILAPAIALCRATAACRADA